MESVVAEILREQITARKGRFVPCGVKRKMSKLSDLKIARPINAKETTRYAPKTFM